jgi:hypothetical protein
LHAIDFDRPGNVLQPLLAQILEGKVELATRIFLYSGRDADATGFRDPFQPRCHVHPVAIDVATLDYDVADIDADAKRDPLLWIDLCVASRHPALDLKGATQRVDHAPELSQQTIASGLDDPSAVFLDLRIQQVAPKNPQPGERPFFIRAHKPAVAGDVGSENGGKAALGASFGHSEPSLSERAAQQIVVASLSRVYRAGLPLRVNRDGSSLWLRLAYVRFVPEAEAASMSYERSRACWSFTQTEENDHARSCTSLPTNPASRALEQGQVDRGQATPSLKACLVHPDEASGRRTNARLGHVQSCYR